MKPGGVDQNVEPAELFYALFDGIAARLRIGDVNRGVGTTGHRLENRCHPGGVTGDSEYRRPALGEQLSHRRAES